MEIIPARAYTRARAFVRRNLVRSRKSRRSLAYALTITSGLNQLLSRAQPLHTGYRLAFRIAIFVDSLIK